MSHRGGKHLLSIVGLAVLALVAAGLSAAALMQVRPAASESVPSSNITTTPLSSLPPTPQVSDSNTPKSTPQSTPGDVESAEDVVVVVLGDQHSGTDTPGVWVDSVARELGWDSVTNLSSSGRGYVKRPGNCDQDVCATFEGTIGLITDQDPDVVVTFGGGADGDNDLSEVAAQYYNELRDALPEAELVAISPVTSEDEAPYWLTMHTRTIRDAVEAVGGTFIDVGQPGVGDGDELSADSQRKVAEVIVEALS